MENKRILLCDDDKAIVDSMVMMLELMDYAVQVADTEAAIRKAAASQPDLILMDIWMSGIDGKDICATLKADPQTKNIPVILISASNHLRTAALQAGADDFVEKPFEMKELIDKVAAILDGR